MRNEISEQKRLRVPDLANLLREMIEEQQFPGDAPMDSTRRLAARYGVSPVTANRAINELVNKKILYRVPGKGTFVSGSRSWRNVGARISFYPYQGNSPNKDYDLLVGLHFQTTCNLLKQNGYDISIISDIERNDPAILKRTLSSSDALILNKEFVTPKTLPLLCSYPCPIILIDSPFVSDNPFHQVVADLFPGFRKAADYFAELGVREVVIAGIADTETHQFRRRLFRRIMSVFHPEIALCEDLTHEYLLNNYGEECGRRIARNYLELPRRPGIFSVSDYISFGMLDVLEGAGLCAGKDFKLISFDNLEIRGIGPYPEPRLTTIEYPYDSLGRELIAMLSELLAARTANTRIIRTPADNLIIRSTT